MSGLTRRASLMVCVVVLAACASDPAPSPSQTAIAPEPFTLYTHCGLGRSLIEFDGAFWKAIGPGPLDDGSGNPPPGFGNPFDEGTIFRRDAQVAIYRSSRGFYLVLQRLDDRPDVAPCA